MATDVSCAGLGGVTTGAALDGFAGVVAGGAGAGAGAGAGLAVLMGGAGRAPLHALMVTRPLKTVRRSPRMPRTNVGHARLIAA
jgi:hypothetical protein